MEADRCDEERWDGDDRWEVEERLEAERRWEEDEDDGGDVLVNGCDRWRCTCAAGEPYTSWKTTPESWPTSSGNSADNKDC